MIGVERERQMNRPVWVEIRKEGKKMKGRERKGKDWEGMDRERNGRERGK